MTTSMTKSAERGSIFRRIVMGLVLAAAIGGIAAPASAETWREHRERVRHERWVREHRGYYAAPAPVYAPPPVVYAPPPGPAVLNFVFPLRFH